MTNVVNFRTHSLIKARQQSSAASPLLDIVTRGLNEIGRTEFKTKDDLEQALLFIALSNEHLRHLISHITNDESRAGMLARTDRIERLVKDAGRKAATL